MASEHRCEFRMLLPDKVTLLKCSQAIRLQGHDTNEMLAVGGSCMCEGIDLDRRLLRRELAPRNHLIIDAIKCNLMYPKFHEVIDPIWGRQYSFEDSGWFA